MKRVVILIGAMVLFFVANVQAKGTKVATKLPSNLKHELAKEIDYPKDAKDAEIEGVVYLKLFVTEDLGVKIVEMNATHPDLGAYVREELADAKIKNNDAPIGQVYLLKIDFSILE